MAVKVTASPNNDGLTEDAIDVLVLVLPKGFTVKLRGVVFVRAPEVPLMVTGTVPVVAVADADKVSTLLVVAGFGLKSAVTPLGSPEAERVTLPEKPFDGVIVMVLVPLLPCVTVTLLGLADSEKFAVV